MKNKVTMLLLTGALALSAYAPSAMARNQKGSAARLPNAVSKSASAKAASKKSASRSAIPPHTVLNGATHNVWP